MRTIVVLLLTIGALLSSCGKSTVGSQQEYLQWLNNEQNRLVFTRYINGLQLKVKYIPYEYLVNRELENMGRYTAAQKDSIMDQYKNNLAFVMAIGPDERKESGNDIMYRNVADYTSYAERTYNMNFEMEKFISLSVDGKSYTPVLSAMENIYGLSTKRNITFVFAPQEKNSQDLTNADEIDFIYKDEMFALGTNHFVFSGKDIQNIPLFPFGEIEK